jgi:hypothetical protein
LSFARGRPTQLTLGIEPVLEIVTGFGPSRFEELECAPSDIVAGRRHHFISSGTVLVCHVHVLLTVMAVDRM